MSNPVLEAIANRRSIRGYEAARITKEQLGCLLDAAVQSPSASNLQPWHFSVVQNTTIFDEINTEAAKMLEREKTDIFFGAQTAIFISCKADSRWGRLDSGIAVENIALAAHSMGLGSVILGRPDAAFTGPRGEYFNNLLKFPDGYSFAVAIAVGIPTTTKEAHPLHPDRIVFID